MIYNKSAFETFDKLLLTSSKMSDSEEEEIDSQQESTSAESIFLTAKATIDALGESVETLNHQIEKLSSFYKKIKNLSSFTKEEKEKVDNILKQKTEERVKKISEMNKKMEIYENQILTIQQHIEERTAILEDDDASTVLEEHEDLMELMVGRQAELTLKLKNSSDIIIEDVEDS